MKPLRIQFFTNFVHQQGTYFRFHNLAVALTRLGQQVELLSLDHNTQSRQRVELRDGVAYRIVPSARGLSFVSPLLHPLNVTQMRALADSSPCDVAHLFQPFPVAAVAWDACCASVKFYDWDDLWIGGLMAGSSGSLRVRAERAVIRYFETMLPTRANFVTTCGGFLAGLARARGARQVSAVFNGLWPVPPTDKNEARRALGLVADARYVGFMGRTCDELCWIFDAIRANAARWPALRFALCGPPDNCLDELEPELRGRVDYLGQLTPTQTAVFAAALDLGLLPLAETPFNRSRFPIKFAEYMAAGAPVLCSEVGECGRLAAHLPWVLKAGRSQAEWRRAFTEVMPMLAARALPVVNHHKVEEIFSWETIAAQLLKIYRAEIAQATVSAGV